MNKKYRILVVILLFTVLVLCGCSEKKTTVGVELLKNGDFSILDSDGMPQNWITDAYVIEKSYTDYEVVQSEDGNAVQIVNHYANDARFVQTVSVDSNSYYLLHGYIKANA